MASSLQQELQRAHQQQLQRVAVHQQVNEITYDCFKLCLKAPDLTRLSASEETCFENCAARRFEAQQMVAARVAGSNYVKF